MKYLKSHKIFENTESELDLSVPTTWNLYDTDPRMKIQSRRVEREMTKISKQFKDDLKTFYGVFEKGDYEIEELRRIELIDKDLVEEVIKTWDIQEEDLDDNDWVDQELWEFGDNRLRSSLLKTYFDTIYGVMKNASELGATDSDPRTAVWMFAITQLTPYTDNDLKGHDAQTLVDDVIPF